MTSTRYIAGSLLSLGLAVATYAPSAHALTPFEEWQAGWAAYQAIEAIPAADRGLVSQTQEFSTVINARREDVFEVYANVDNSLGRHPFLQSITHHLDSWRCGVLTRDFTAVEIVPFGPPPPLTLQTVAQQRIHLHEYYYDSDTFDVPGVITHQHVTFEEIGHGATRVTERLTFEAPAPFIDFTVQGGVFTHQVVAASLKQALESGALGNDHGNHDADGAYLREPRHDGHDFDCEDRDHGDRD